MKLVYLDTNEWNYLFSHPDYSDGFLANLRAQLIRSVADGGLLPVGSVPLFEEIMATVRRAPSKCEAMRELVFQVVDERWLIPLSQRHRLEAAAGGLLAEERRYLPRRTRRGLYKMDSSALHEIAEGTYRQGQGFKAEQESIRQHLHSTLPETVGAPSAKVGQIIDNWWREELDIESWVRGLVGERTLMTAVGSAPPSKPVPELLPSAWHFMSYKLARIKRNLGEGRRIDTSDYVDAEHYAAGAYVDVLVSDDVEFRETCMSLGTVPFLLAQFTDLVSFLGER